MLFDTHKFFNGTWTDSFANERICKTKTATKKKVLRKFIVQVSAKRNFLGLARAKS